jgi:hypothetical protein
LSPKPRGSAVSAEDQPAWIERVHAFDRELMGRIEGHHAQSICVILIRIGVSLPNDGRLELFVWAHSTASMDFVDSDCAEARIAYNHEVKAKR